MVPSTREHMIKSVAMTAHVLAQSSEGPSDAQGDAPLGCNAKVERGWGQPETHSSEMLRNTTMLTLHTPSICYNL